MLTEIHAPATISINTSLSKACYLHKFTPWPGQIHPARTQKVNTFKILSVEGEIEYQVREHSCGLTTRPLKLSLPSFTYLTFHEPLEFDSPVVPSLSAKTHRASWGPGKLTAPPAQDEPSQQLLTAREMQPQQSELRAHLKSNNCQDYIIIRIAKRLQNQNLLTWRLPQFPHSKNKPSKVDILF